MKLFFANCLAIFTIAVFFCSCTITPYSIGEKWAKDDISNNILKYKIIAVSVEHDRIKCILLFTKYHVNECLASRQIPSEDFEERLLAYNQTVRNFLKEEYGFDVFDSVRRESESITTDILKSYKTTNDFWRRFHGNNTKSLKGADSLRAGEKITQTAVRKFEITEIVTKSDTNTYLAPEKISDIDSTGYLQEMNIILRPSPQEIMNLTNFLQENKR